MAIGGLLQRKKLPFAFYMFLAIMLRDYIKISYFKFDIF